MGVSNLLSGMVDYSLSFKTLRDPETLFLQAKECAKISIAKAISQLMAASDKVQLKIVNIC